MNRCVGQWHTVFCGSHLNIWVKLFKCPSRIDTFIFALSCNPISTSEAPRAQIDHPGTSNISYFTLNHDPVRGLLMAMREWPSGNITINHLKVWSVCLDTICLCILLITQREQWRCLFRYSINRLLIATKKTKHGENIYSGVQQYMQFGQTSRHVPSRLWWSYLQRAVPIPTVRYYTCKIEEAFTKYLFVLVCVQVLRTLSWVFGHYAMFGTNLERIIVVPILEFFAWKMRRWTHRPCKGFRWWCLGIFRGGRRGEGDMNIPLNRKIMKSPLYHFLRQGFFRVFFRDNFLFWPVSPRKKRLCTSYRQVFSRESDPQFSLDPPQTAPSRPKFPPLSPGFRGGTKFSNPFIYLAGLAALYAEVLMIMMIANHHTLCSTHLSYLIHLSHKTE